MSNLPPGVSSSDIPGNRPEDARHDILNDHLADMLLERYGIDGHRWTDADWSEWDTAVNLLFGITERYRREVE